MLTHFYGTRSDFQHIIIDQENTYCHAVTSNFQESVNFLSDQSITCYHKKYKRFSPLTPLSNDPDSPLSRLYSFYSEEAPHRNDIPNSALHLTYPIHLQTYTISSGYSLPTSLLEEYHQLTYGPKIPHYSYPIATRYISSDGTVYIERPPFQAIIDYKPSGAYSRMKKRLSSRKVWIPWSIFIFNPNSPDINPKMFFSHKSLFSYEDVYFPTFLPNTYSDGRICFSASLNNLPMESSDENTSNNISSLYAYMINEYFAGAWNADLSSPFSYIVNSITTKLPKDFPLAEKCPVLNKYLNPSLDLLSSSGALSNKPTNQAVHNYLCYMEKHYQWTDTHHWTAMLDHASFHYYTLSILSTFSLEEILALYQELSTLYHYDKSTKLNSRSFSDIINYNVQNVSDSNQYHFPSRTESVFAGLSNIISRIALDHHYYPEQAYTSVYILTLNVPYSSTNYPTHGYALAAPNSYVKHDILNTVISNFKYNSDYYTNNSFYVYDVRTNLLTHIPNELLQPYFDKYPTNTYEHIYVDLLQKYFQTVDSSQSSTLSHLFPHFDLTTETSHV